MKILAFDTACGGCSAALWEDGRVIARDSAAMRHGQAEALMPMLAGVMEAGGLPFTALDRLAVTVGPGSFTGVRVGLAAARGLALAANLPILGLTTTEAFIHAVPAAACPPGGVLLAAVDARRSDVFLQPFDAGSREPLADIAAVGPDDLAAWLAGQGLAAENCRLVGDGASLLSAVDVLAVDPLPDPVVLAALAASRVPAAEPPAALYIRPPDVVLPRHGGQLRP